MNLERAVEPTRRRKGAETQGFRLLGAITRWVRYESSCCARRVGDRRSGITRWVGYADMNHRPMANRICALVTGFALSLSLFADDSSAPANPETTLPPSNKGDYNLFNPTPRAQMREMSTDRPDKTESPYTVDAGHFQIEMDLVSYTRDRLTVPGADCDTDILALAPVNLKVGLLNQVDLQLLLDTYTWVLTKDRATGSVTRQRGFGDVTTRLKINWWGDDGGATALAFMPFVKFPTSQNGLGNRAVEGGIIIPLAVELPLGWSMGLMTEFDFMQSADGAGYHPEFVNSITFGHEIVGRLAGYIEFFSQVSADQDAPWIGTVDLGLTYRLTDNLQLDAGVNLGVTRSADDLVPFLGISLRF